MPPAVSRIVLDAQEDLRREIARAMHDGPAQTLTNIVLQAQIVERLVATDPALAPRASCACSIAMVQQTLEATKTFIFDVRPMVLDDLGLVPTLRRAARDRGRRAGVPVEFDSLGTDRRLPMDLESGLFRILDEALAAYLGARPTRVTMRLDWSDRLEARVHAVRDADTAASRRRAGRRGEAPPTGRRPAAGARGDDRGPPGRRPGRGRDGARRDADRRPARRRPGARSRAGRLDRRHWPSLADGRARELAPRGRGTGADGAT